MANSKRSSFSLRRCVFETTLGCNLKCRHCGSSAGVPRDDELSTEEASDLFVQLADVGCRRVTISGGEALTRGDWPLLIEAAASTGMQVGMITNGVLFDQEAASTAKKMGLGAVAFSLDGMPSTHDSIRGKSGQFKTVERAIQAAKDIGLLFGIITHVNQLNIGELKDIHDFTAEKGAYAWQVQMGAEMGNMCDNQELVLRPSDLPRIERVLSNLVHLEEQTISVANSIGYFGEFESDMRKGLGARCFQGCAAGKRTLGIESNGNVKGCLALEPGHSNGVDRFVEGNIRHRSLAEIWNDEEAFSYSRHASVEKLTGFCGRCPHARKCMGGCRSNMISTGDTNENQFCIYRVTHENTMGRTSAGRIAATLLASFLGTALISSCDSDDDDTSDSGPDTDADSDNDVDVDADVYDMVPWPE